jgi:hypothetical protein
VRPRGVEIDPLSVGELILELLFNPNLLLPLECELTELRLLEILTARTLVRVAVEIFSQDSSICHYL